MINNVNSTPSFGSTWIPSNKMLEAAEKLNPYFEVKGIIYGSNKKPQQVADMIDFGKAAFLRDAENNGLRVIGKDGGEGGADTFIGRVLKKFIPEAKFTNDVKPVEIDGPVIDMTKLDLNA